MNQRVSERNLNLTAHREPNSVWARPGWDGARPVLARWLVGVGGSALAIQGVRQRSTAGAILAGVGATLACWALTDGGGVSAVADRWVGWARERARGDADDLVQQASADSFPASDAPGWTPTVSTGTRPRRTPIP